MKKTLTTLFVTTLLTFGTLFITLIASNGLAHAQGTACSGYGPGQSVASQDFAVPWNVFTSARELLMQVTCTTTQAVITMGKGDQFQYIYNQGYWYRNGNWQPHTYTGGTPVGDWLIGSASKTLSLSSGDLNKTQYIVGYICTWTNSEWKCGCSTSGCSGVSGNKWQLQSFVAEDAPSSTSSSSSSSGGEGSIPDGLTYYGWYSWLSTPPASALSDFQSYTNSVFTPNIDTLKTYQQYNFKHVAFHLTESEIFREYYKLQGKSLPSNWASVNYTGIPNYENDILTAYRTYLNNVKSEMVQKGLLNSFKPSFDVLYIVDEPALRPNIYPNANFLKIMVDEAKAVFPGKKITMALAGDPQGGKPHLAPPSNLDLLTIDPYFWNNSHSCNETTLRNYLYTTNPNSSINWAKQYNIPIVLTGDSMLRGSTPPKDCYLEVTLKIAKEDPAIVGLVWFVYDREFNEAGGTGLRGAANNTTFVNFVKSLK